MKALLNLLNELDDDEIVRIVREWRNKIHKLIEVKEIKTISQPNMAKRIGVQPRTYTEYSRGTNQPLAMKALLNLLNELNDDEIVKIVREWRNKSDEI
jgi:DNA-binding XRE family transcriptional regulator